MLLAGLLCAGCGKPPPPLSKPWTFDPSAFSGHRAYDEVQRFVDLGPRDAGTAGARRAAEYLRNRLEALGVEAALESFEDISPKGRLIFRNVAGRLPGTRPGLIVLGSHYDTKSGLAAGFEGANDSGSSTGTLLELARVFADQGASEYRGPEIRFVFFDGEEAMEHYGAHDGLHGSRYHAEELVRSGRAGEVLAVIVLDMIGDQDLTVTLPRNSSPPLVSAVFEAAREEGVRSLFSLFPHAVGDDHQPFLERGMPAVDIIDFAFGSAPGRNDYWHTAQDRMDRISPESLAIVGRVTLRVVNKMIARTP